MYIIIYAYYNDLYYIKEIIVKLIIYIFQILCYQFQITNIYLIKLKIFFYYFILVFIIFYILFNF